VSVDTQGHEGHVLSGATRLLARRAPWVIEYWPYGLALAGGLEHLQELISNDFERVIDVRQSLNSGHAVEMAASRIAEIRCDVSDADDYTDLLLLPAKDEDHSIL